MPKLRADERERNQPIARRQIAVSSKLVIFERLFAVVVVAEALDLHAHAVALDAAFPPIEV